ncbi:MAG: NTPase [Chloroflexota bacterium]
MKSAYFLTGRPGVGKTTLLREVLADLPASAGGFYTEEVRQGGVREGFRIVTLDGQTATLASVNVPSPHRVSKYGVSIENLEQIGVVALRRAIKTSDIIVIDEVGKMELFSAQFQQAVLDAIESGKAVLGTIMLAPRPWTDRLKQHPRVRVVQLTEANRDVVREEIREVLEGLAKRP